jgi:HlyD family secretion protein
VIILLAAVLAAGGYFWWRSVRSTEPTELSASGAVEARQYQVASVIAGRVTKVAVSEGDVVKRGQTLVVLDQAALKLQVEQAEQGVKAAEAALSNAKEDGTDADVSAARARLNQAEAAVDLAKVQLGYATVTAPQWCSSHAHDQCGRECRSG